MKNNDTLKKIARKTSNLKHLAEKDALTHQEYMQLVCSDEWQKAFNKTTERLKKISPEWY